MLTPHTNGRTIAVKDPSVRPKKGEKEIYHERGLRVTLRKKKSRGMKLCLVRERRDHELKREGWTEKKRSNT